jgi:hypothetical protein
MQFWSVSFVPNYFNFAASSKDRFAVFMVCFVLPSSNVKCILTALVSLYDRLVYFITKYLHVVQFHIYGVTWQNTKARTWDIKHVVPWSTPIWIVMTHYSNTWSFPLLLPYSILQARCCLCDSYKVRGAEIPMWISQQSIFTVSYYRRVTVLRRLI